MDIVKESKAYHDADSQMDEGKAREYGKPAYTLFSSKKMLSFHAEINVANSRDEVLYTSKTKAITLHDVTSIFDKNNHEVAKMNKKLVSLHAIHTVTMDDGTSFQLSNEIFHVVQKITNIEGLGWQLRGNIALLQFGLYDEKGAVIALIGHKVLSVKDNYSVDIYRPEYEKIIVAILIALQHMISKR